MVVHQMMMIQQHLLRLKLTQYTLTVTAGEGGSVSTQGGTYDEGSTVNIIATAGSGYIFQNWSNGSTDNPISVIVNQNM